MRFPLLIFFARPIPKVSPVPTKSLDTVGSQWKPSQKCVSGRAHSNDKETRDTLRFCFPSPRELLLRSRLSTPEKIPSSP